MMRLALAVVVMLVAASSAQAQPLRPLIPRFEQTAITTWGGGRPPACGKIRYAWTPALAVGTIAEADPATCTVRFDAVTWRHLRDYRDVGTLCVMMLHEIGHLYGQQHAAKGVMSPDLPSWERVPVCRRATRGLW